jgi:hypothetical protein
MKDAYIWITISCLAIAVAYLIWDWLSDDETELNHWE